MNIIFEVLNKYYGYTSFKEGQYEIIINILKGRDSFCILPTGGGKSICYQIPAMIFKGITIVRWTYYCNFSLNIFNEGSSR